MSNNDQQNKNQNNQNPVQNNPNGDDQKKKDGHIDPKKDVNAPEGTDDKTKADQANK